jgi:phosphoribosyl 1,2-cyclic phosphodiesterase
MKRVTGGATRLFGSYPHRAQPRDHLAEATIRLRLLLLLIILTSGCATAHDTTVLPGSIAVHTFRRDYANAHLVVQGSNAFLVDSGVGENAAKLANDIRSVGIDPAKLRAIVLSHGHADHAGGSAYFKNMFGTRLIAGAREHAMLSRGRNDHLCPTERTSRMQSDQNARFDQLRPTSKSTVHAI